MTKNMTSKKLKKLREKLNLALDRNDAKEIIRLRKELLERGDEEELEEMTRLVDK